MKISVLSLFALFVVPSAFAADLIVCTKDRPQWDGIMDGKLGAQSKGPAVIINTKASRVTWIGAGGYVMLTGEKSAMGVKIIRIDGRAVAEKILSAKTTGRVLDLELSDSLGGTGLMRIVLDNIGGGNASWQHATDSESERFDFCTTDVLQ